MAQSPANAGTFDNSPIVSEETGVAKTYEATKNIKCGDHEWRLMWGSGPDEDSLRGHLTVISGDTIRSLPQMQSRVFDEFASVDSISATCNRGEKHGAVRSTLLIDGNSKKNGEKVLAQVRVDGDLNLEVTFDTAG